MEVKLHEAEFPKTKNNDFIVGLKNKEVFMKYYTKPELNEISLAQTESVAAFMNFDELSNISGDSPVTSWNVNSGKTL